MPLIKGSPVKPVGKNRYAALIADGIGASRIQRAGGLGYLAVVFDVRKHRLVLLGAKRIGARQINNKRPIVSICTEAGDDGLRRIIGACVSCVLSVVFKDQRRMA